MPVDGLRLLCQSGEMKLVSHGGYSGKASWTILLRAMRDLGGFTQGASHLINDLRADLFHGVEWTPEPERRSS